MIRFENISKSFKTKEVLKDVSFTVGEGKLVAIIGESGCGKTTLLKMINCLIRPKRGTIYIKGENIQSLDVIELRRKMGYVIQQTGLFPHMTVRENIEIIPKVQKKDANLIIENTLNLMEMVGLDSKEFLDRYPTELSGGQQQRVGVARAFATDPEIILMDEPFSALDPMTRADLQDELVELQSKLKKTIVFVTHDMDEAIKIADMICIMKDGKILQYDTPENILKNPYDEYVSSFVGAERIWSSPEFIKVSDIMIEKPVTASKDLSVLKCMDKMRQYKVDSLIIVEKNTRQMQGIVKASKLRNVEDKSQASYGFMQSEFPTLSPDDTILDALKIVNEKSTSTVPVVDENNRLKGLITRSSLVTTLSEQYFDFEEDDIV
ncbi:MAG: ATP-binding cassette domain-containing protein [Clostridia bacterium]|nr:ATP-binding cassette domain-containing protein [Clostridia bacterium]